MPIQKYAVPPNNVPIMQHSKTVPNLSAHRNTLRSTLRQSDVKQHEEIQAAASMKPKDRRRRTNRQMTTVAFQRDRFDKGLHNGRKSLARRSDFIQSLADKTRAMDAQLMVDEGRRQYDEADEYVLNFRKGTHLTSPREVGEMREIGREGRLYKEAGDAIRTSEEFKDYREQHVGHVRLPPRTEEAVRSGLESEA
jgi:hypothetical protein